MGWIIAFLFAITTAVLALFLFISYTERRTALAQLHQCTERLKLLEPVEIERTRLQTERDGLAKTYLTLRARVADLVNADEEKIRVLAEATALRDKFNAQLADAKARFAAGKNKMTSELTDLEARLVPLRNEHQTLSEEQSLREMGFYQGRFNLSTSVAYKLALDKNQEQQKAMLKAGDAAMCSREWMIDGSVEAGRRQTEKILALMLRAFNGECDAAVGKVRFNNFQAMEARINRAFTTINKQGETQACSLSDKYLALKIAELGLTHEHAQKVQAEREEQQAIKEQMREEVKAAREAERAAQEAEAEEHRRQVALDKAREELARAAEEHQSAEKQAELEARMHELEQQLAEAHASRERALSMAQQTKTSHVYVVSNVGAFGENVFKIGMTRRLDPMDRIWELSGAAVPFDFDVHAIIRTEDAPALEAKLHQRFADRRLNMMNERKEFFFVTIEEIAEVVRERCGDIELTLTAEAAEFYQSEARRRAHGMPLLAQRQLVTSVEVLA